MPRIECHADALLLPATGGTARGAPGAKQPATFDGGVYDAAGRLLPLGIHAGIGGRNIAAPMAGEGSAATLPGTWLFGGWLRHHFGHFVHECLGRLWAWPELAEQPDGILFLPHGWLRGQHPPRRAGGDGDRRFLPALLPLLGIEAPVRVVIEPTRVERLVLPQQLLLMPCPEDPEAPRRHQAFLARMGEAAATAGPAAGRAYLSRGWLAPPAASFVLESVIEENLARAGYAILHPETMPLPAQVAAYRGLTDLIFAEGSALHLAAPFLGPGSRVAALWREGRRLGVMHKQVLAAGVKAVTEFDAMLGWVAPEPVNWRKAHGLPDFARLGATLEAEGFIPPDTWRVPAPTEIEAAIAERIALLEAAEPGCGARFLPAQRPTA